ncbi:MAG: hypothetical protein RIB98_17220 [Acidimicrobiales bacterium]
MTVGEVSFWAAVYVLVGWSLVASIGTAASEVACVATHYEHAPGMPRYCEGSMAGDVAFFLYPVLAIGLGAAALVLVRRRPRKQSAHGPERR